MKTLGKLVGSSSLYSLRHVVVHQGQHALKLPGGGAQLHAAAVIMMMMILMMIMMMMMIVTAHLLGRVVMTKWSTTKPCS